MRPTYDELFEMVQFLQKRVKELEERLNLNSKNSSKPPSTDQKKNKKAPKGGARTGHPGHHRKLYPADRVSTTITSSLNECINFD